MKNKTFGIISAAWCLTSAFMMWHTSDANAVNGIGQPVDQYYANKTYSVQVADFSPVSGQTDILTITAPTDKIVRLNRIQVTADASATGAVDFYVYRQTSADSGGTSSQLVPVPHDTNYPAQPNHSSSGFVIGQSYQINATSTGCNNAGASGNTIGLLFIANATSPSSGTCVAYESAHASVNLYTANPTLGSNRSVIRGDHYVVPNSGTAGYPAPAWVEDFGVRSDQQIVLRNGQSLAFGLAGNWAGTPSGVSLYILISWEEE